MLNTEASDTKPNRVELHLPFSTVVTVLLVALFVICLKILAPLLMTLFLALLLAVSLTPLVRWFERKGLSRRASVASLALILAATLAAITALIVPQLLQEFSNFLENIPKFKEQVLGFLAETNPLKSFVTQVLGQKTVVPKLADMAPLLSIGNIALNALAKVILIFVFTVYLIGDGPGVMQWFGAFFSPITQGKIKQTSEEVAKIISSYVAGQFITSILSFFYVLIVLSLLHVPSALLLASLAGLFDVLPVLGFFLAVIPAMLFALARKRAQTDTDIAS